MRRGSTSVTARSPDAARLRHSGRIFAFTLMAGFIFVALVGQWRGMPVLTRSALALAVISLLAGLLVPGRLEPVRRGWMKFGEAIGRVTTPIMMGVVYYAVITPVGLVRRLFTRGPARPASHWHARDRRPAKSRMERQF